ncbi:MAG: aminotransferase class I/II-fold pyridoxal phosphate-dependent enzyme [Bacteroidetes bacterium]|nr:aminotransferase class I/II-fold pyridoxal phosphate-dependent enzyme [Bacteroidota bacterium]
MTADRIHLIGSSPTLKVAAKAKALKEQGIDVIDFSVGEPDFGTPAHIKEAAKKAIDENFTKYTANEGILPLRKAIARQLEEEHGLRYDPASEIIVSNGAKHSIYNAMMAVVNDGDEVIIPAPYWVSYPEMVKLANGRPVIVQTREEDGFRLTADQLRDTINASTKAVFINNPCNPTGAGYTRQELEALAEVIVEEDIVCIADEIYGKLMYDNLKFTRFASLGEEVKKRTITIDGVSKAYSMTGWRIGWAAAPKDITAAMAKVQSHATSNPSSVSQRAALEAYKGPQYEISKMAAEFEKRRNFVVYKLQGMAGVSCPMPRGAFYAFPNVSSFYRMEYDGVPIRNSYGMAYFLLKHANVAIVPGDAFGSDDFIRISYATSMANLTEGMTRIADALAKLKPAPKRKLIKLANTETVTKHAVPVDREVKVAVRDALVAEAEAHLSYSNYFEWNANINGMIVQLRTNVGHLYDFWVENWYPAQLEADIEPHGVIYAVDGVPGREPHAFYNSDTKTGILFNADHYGSLRSLALGLVTDVAERVFDIHAVRGLTLDVGGEGVLLLGPAGTKKTELLWRLFEENEQVALHSSDYVFVRYGGGYAAADNPERKMYLQTNAVAAYAPLAKLFDKSKCENVTTKVEDCRNDSHKLQESCPLNSGAPYSYDCAKKSHAMLDPYWLGGMARHVKRIDIRHVFILRNDPVTTAVQKLDVDEALHVVEAGYPPGTSIGGKQQPYYNPHLLVGSDERMELQKRFFTKLFQSAAVHQLNAGAVTLTEMVAQVLSHVGANGR